MPLTWATNIYLSGYHLEPRSHRKRNACMIRPNINMSKEQRAAILTASIMSETTTEARMLQPKTYEANCHCGLIKYTVKLDDALAPEGAGKIGNCNCSICTKNGWSKNWFYSLKIKKSRFLVNLSLGYLLVYPRREDVKFLDDSESKLRAYFFGAKSKPHKSVERTVRGEHHSYSSLDSAQSAEAASWLTSKTPELTVKDLC